MRNEDTISRHDDWFNKDKNEHIERIRKIEKLRDKGKL